jgi:hypothetical protein
LGEIKRFFYPPTKTVETTIVKPSKKALKIPQDLSQNIITSLIEKSSTREIIWSEPEVIKWRGGHCKEEITTSVGALQRITFQRDTGNRSTDFALGIVTEGTGYSISLTASFNQFNPLWEVAVEKYEARIAREEKRKAGCQRKRAKRRI